MDTRLRRLERAAAIDPSQWGAYERTLCKAEGCLKHKIMGCYYDYNQMIQASEIRIELVAGKTDTYATRYTYLIVVSDRDYHSDKAIVMYKLNKAVWNIAKCPRCNEVSQDEEEVRSALLVAWRDMRHRFSGIAPMAEQMRILQQSIIGMEGSL